MWAEQFDLLHSIWYCRCWVLIRYSKQPFLLLLLSVVLCGCCHQLWALIHETKGCVILRLGGREGFSCVRTALTKIDTLHQFVFAGNSLYTHHPFCTIKCTDICTSLQPPRAIDTLIKTQARFPSSSKCRAICSAWFWHDQSLAGEVHLEHCWCINTQLVHRFGADCRFG